MNETVVRTTSFSVVNLPLADFEFEAEPEDDSDDPLLTDVDKVVKYVLDPETIVETSALVLGVHQTVCVGVHHTD